MCDINVLTLSGRLTRDPEVRYAKSGAAVASFSVASNRRYAGKDGKTEEETAFVPCVLFGKPAEWAAKEHKRGEPILVSGRLRTDSWEAGGGPKSRLVLVVDQVQFLTRPVTDGGTQREEVPMPEEVKKAVPF